MRLTEFTYPGIAVSITVRYPSNEEERDKILEGIAKLRTRLESFDIEIIPKPVNAVPRVLRRGWVERTP